MDPISSAASGLVAANARFTAASGGVISAANAGGGGALASAIVGQSMAGEQLKAAASVQATTDQMYAALVDITV